MKNFIILALFLSSLAYAGSSGKSGVKIAKLMTGYSHKGIFFEVNEVVPNPSSCPATSSSQSTLAVIPARSDVNQVLSILLTAKATNTAIDIDVYDDICFEGWAVIRKVTLN